MADVPFLRAGFNASNRDTGIRGWTRPLDGGKHAPAELRQFACGDYFWYGERFLAWGERCVLGSHWGIDLPGHWQRGLPQSELP